jgi:hypothetical protein
VKQTNILTHLAAIAIVTILSTLIYVSVQQTHRSVANDPQLQIAGDISTRLKNGGLINSWFDNDITEISQSLSVFSILYNDKNEPVLSTGVLHGKMPSLPSGVFNVAVKKGEDVFTWQPEKGVRMAIVLRPVKSSAYSFVAVGRSLYEVERREQSLLLMAAVSWVLCISIILGHWVISFLKNQVHSNN